MTLIFDTYVNMIESLTGWHRTPHSTDGQARAKTVQEPRRNPLS